MAYSAHRNTVAIIELFVNFAGPSKTGSKDSIYFLRLMAAIAFVDIIASIAAVNSSAGIVNLGTADTDY